MGRKLLQVKKRVDASVKFNVQIGCSPFLNFLYGTSQPQSSLGVGSEVLSSRRGRSCANCVDEVPAEIVNRLVKYARDMFSCVLKTL